MFESLTSHGTVAAALIAPPGPDAIAALAPLADTALSASVRVDLLVALERQASWLTAVMQPVLAKVADAVEAATRPLLDTERSVRHAAAGSTRRVGRGRDHLQARRCDRGRHV